MFETLTICVTLLLALGGCLWFAHLHMRTTKAHSEALKAELMALVAEQLKAAEAQVAKYHKDLEQVNANQLVLGNELATMKSQYGLRGGVFGHRREQGQV